MTEIDRRKITRRSLDQVIDELNSIYLSLEYIADGIIIINQDGSIYFATEQAKKALSTVGHLVTINQQISFFREKEIKLFKEFLKVLNAIQNNSDNQSEPHTIFLSKTHSQYPLIISCFKCISFNSENPIRGILVVRDPDNQPKEQLSAFVEQFKLTPIEFRLALALSNGKTLAEYCEIHTVSINTARTQLKNIFSKTEVTRQSELLRIIFNYRYK